MFLGVPVTSNNSENSAAIGGSVGGVIVLLMIIAVLCIVIVCMRRCHEKKKFTLNSIVLYNTTKLNTNVTIEYKVSHNVVKVNAMDNGNTITPGNSDFPITPNPSYGTHNETIDKYGYAQPNDSRGSDVPITINPTYDVPTKPYSKTSEDDYNYVQPNEFVQYSDVEDTIKMDTNPSYGVSIENKATSFIIKITDFDTTKQYDYDYVRDDHLLHNNTATNPTGDMNEDSINSFVDYRNKNHPSYSPSSTIHVTEGEYGVVNQPRS